MHHKTFKTLEQENKTLYIGPGFQKAANHRFETLSLHPTLMI